MNLKHLILTILSISFLSTCYSQASIMTFNIRYDNPNDGENWWDLRKDEVNELLHYYEPDFLGLQEALPHQTNYIGESLSKYDHIGYGRDGKNTNSEGAPIFYNTSKYDLLEEEMIWLSETPEKVSKGWDASLNRIAVYGVFVNKTTLDTLYIFNAHFDHRGEMARLNSAKLLLKIIEEKQLQNKKVILIGDLNAEPDSAPIQALKRLLNDSYQSEMYPVYGPIGTFSGFDTSQVLTRRIDYIFTRNLTVKSYRSIDDRRRNNLYPSDHLPVFVKF